MIKIIKTSCEYKNNPLGIDIASPRISWQMASDRFSVMQAAYRIQVSLSDQFESLVWDTGIVKADTSINVAYEGEKLCPRTCYFYRIMVWDTKRNASDWSKAAFFETGLMNGFDKEAKWITTPQKVLCSRRACPIFRKVFRVREKPVKARLYATALGAYEMYINGDRVGDELFAPGWTDYAARLQYQTYDITDMLLSDENVIGAAVGNGWYFLELNWPDFFRKPGLADRKSLMAQMVFTYADGTEEVLYSNKDWKTSAGPILMCDIYDGEIYDAREEQPGWNAVGFHDENWDSTEEYAYTKNIILAQENVPTRITQEIKPIDLFVTPAGETVIDFGQNMTGWVRFKVNGSAGDKVTLKHAEVLDSIGNFYTKNLRQAKQTVTYILKGKETECFEPHFTFQGFRYVQVVDYPGEIKKENFVGCVIHSDLDDIGSFECSDKFVEKLQQNICWSQRDNFLDIPTDCPQRDERLGWTADAQVFMRTACYNMNVVPLFEKWLADLKVDQTLEKGVPAVVPNVLGDAFSSSSAWGDAAVICPWTIYLSYGDSRILEKQYNSMKMWVEFIRNQGNNPYIWNTGFHYGDWLALDAQPGKCEGLTSKPLIATAYYAYSTKILFKTASILGQREDAQKYEELYLNIVENFRKEFVTADGKLTSQTQTAYVLALHFELLLEKDRVIAAKELKRLLNENQNHFTTGFVGTPYICLVLSKYGMNDLAYELLLHRDYPSWLYSVEKGATTIWEHWDGIMENGEFWSESMNSFNHYAYGSIGEWLYRVVAGLDTDCNAPGFKRILIRPQIGKGLDYAKIRLDSMYGTIRTGWKKDASKAELTAEIPVNTTALVELPDAVFETVKINGLSLQQCPLVMALHANDEKVSIELGSGIYHFTFERQTNES